MFGFARQDWAVAADTKIKEATCVVLPPFSENNTLSDSRRGSWRKAAWRSWRPVVAAAQCGSMQERLPESPCVPSPANAASLTSPTGRHGCRASSSARRHPRNPLSARHSARRVRFRSTPVASTCFIPRTSVGNNSSTRAHFGSESQNSQRSHCLPNQRQ